jgi:hypothetical protein
MTGLIVALFAGMLFQIWRSMHGKGTGGAKGKGPTKGPGGG